MSNTRTREQSARMLLEAVQQAVGETDLERRQSARLEYHGFKNNPEIPLKEFVDVMLRRIARDESHLAVQHALAAAAQADDRELHLEVFRWVASHPNVQVDHVLAPAIRYQGNWDPDDMALPVARLLRQARTSELDRLVEAGYRFEGEHLVAVQKVLEGRPQTQAAAAAQALITRYQLETMQPATPMTASQPQGGL